MTESRNSRWRSSKPEVPIFQLVEELATHFQIIIPSFRGLAIQWRHSQHCNTITEGFSRWICVANMCTSGDMSTSGLASTILQLSLPVRLFVQYCRYYRWIAGPENISLVVGIAFPLCVQLEFPHEEVVTLFTNENVTPSDFSPVVSVVS